MEDVKIFKALLAEGVDLAAEFDCRVTFANGNAFVPAGLVSRLLAWSILAWHRVSDVCDSAKIEAGDRFLGGSLVHETNRINKFTSRQLAVEPEPDGEGSEM